MMNGRMGGDAVTHTGQIRDADTEVTVRAAQQRFVEQARFKQHAEPADQVAALDAGIACQEARHSERPGRNRRTGFGVLLDSKERSRDHVETTALGERQAALQVVRLPPVVVVQDHDMEPPGVAAGAQQVVEARVPGSCRSPGAAVAKEVHDDAGRLPCPDRLLGSLRGGIGTRVIDDDHPPGRSRLTFDGGKSPAGQQP